MVKKLYQILLEIPQKRVPASADGAGHVIEKQILGSFEFYKKGLGKSYHARNIYTNIILLAKLGGRYRAMKHAFRFEREIGSNKVGY